jgi:CheY-like chemotaxis protein
MYILLVEDDKKVAAFIRKGLQEESYTVDVAYDGKDGLSLASVNQYDLIILDIMLPKKDGMAVLSELRNQRVSTPVLIITARDSLEDLITEYSTLFQIGCFPRIVSLPFGKLFAMTDSCKLIIASIYLNINSLE